MVPRRRMLPLHRMLELQLRMPPKSLTFLRIRLLTLHPANSLEMQRRLPAKSALEMLWLPPSGLPTLSPKAALKMLRQLQMTMLRMSRLAAVLRAQLAAVL